MPWEIGIIMTEYQIVKAMLCHLCSGLTEDAPLAKGLKEWILNNLAWLDLGLSKKKAKQWSLLQEALHQWRLPEASSPYVLELADGIADILELDAENHCLLSLLISCDRLPMVRKLANLISSKGVELPEILGELCCADDAMHFVRRSPVLRLGLIGFKVNYSSETEVDVKWTLENLLDKAPALDRELVDALIGPRQKSKLTMSDFAEVEDASFLAKLINGAVEQNAKGINILIHGPPGTGKTELARVLAQNNDLRLHAVGEVDDDGDEPNRFDRVSALMLAQKVLEGKKEAIILFDEMEDFIGDSQPSIGDWMARREGSKIFINRMLENNNVPVIWTSNAVGNIDDAIIRRMSFVLKLDYPSRIAAQRIGRSICDNEKVHLSQEMMGLIDQTKEATTVLRNAARSARLAGECYDIQKPANVLIKTLRNGNLPLVKSVNVDMNLYNCSSPVKELLNDIAISNHRDVSILLSGPPGTGKTELAHHFARQLDKPLIAQKSSDLLSKWVGETESNIANAFADARAEQAVLFFDEADSLMFDRNSANANWQVGQVNELLSWLDRHDQPVLAATNHASKLDPATLRRFDFKLELRPLDEEGLHHAFETFFGMKAPAKITNLDNLTPGDFAVVKKQIRFCKNITALEIFKALEKEAELKPDGGVRLGFGR